VGAVVFAEACELSLEGIVSKRQSSFYKSGKSRNWLKTKNSDFARR
jgi:bifunctional non-homologous end joining protein LigD